LEICITTEVKQVENAISYGLYVCKRLQLLQWVLKDIQALNDSVTVDPSLWPAV